jgi:hypothetical protein
MEAVVMFSPPRLWDHPALNPMDNMVSFLGEKGYGRETDHVPPASLDRKNAPPRPKVSWRDA